MTDNVLDTVLSIVKIRLNRADDALDDYLRQRVYAACAELERTGLSLTDDIDDVVLLADYVGWQYGNRDKPGNMPEWLRLARRERFLSAKGREAT